MDVSVPDEASPSSAFSKGWLYDVFISFRGEDTRKNFTGHLYEALTRAGINAFIDDEELKKGEDLTTTFERAIQGSKISIIVFSRQYANSSWCLEELVKIMECRRTPGKLVLPIFYDVDPSHVRKQTDSFGQLFLEHIDEKKVERRKEERWRTALTEASNLCGWDLRNTLDGHEAKFIRMITEEVTRKLNNTYLDVAPYQVGLDSRVQDISNYLRIGDSEDVRMIGILGMGGIGKTTIAKAIYNEFCERFEGKCFLEKVREKKLEKLQKQLLSDILQMTKKEVSSVAAGTALVRQRFRCLRVLIIVDDVDDVKQLRELAGNCHSFGPGSRIIITTRIERVLKEFAVDEIYREKGMDREEALELLSWHAFGISCCPSQYLVLAREVVNYCGGLPLALQVLGSSLFKRSVDEWRSILVELKMIPRGEIKAQLKISYDGLNDNYKRRIFLDIACFFIGMDKNDVMQILDGCGFYATTGIEVLLDRCLITIGIKNKIMMHDLLRDMGRDIVHAENPDFPGEQSRLWRPEDVNDVLIDKSGTEKIEGLALDLPSVKEISFSIEALTNMKRLRLLQLKHVRLTGGYQCLSKKLRWLCWHGFPLEFIPLDLCQPNIVAIDMRYSNLKQVLCEYYGLLDKLKILNLSHSHDLTQLPDFSKFPNLEKLILKDCKRLAKVDKSIGDLKSLVSVNLKGCERLKVLPRSFYKLKSVKTLVLNGCSRFQILPETLGKMASLNTLLIDGTAIKKVPPSIVRLEKLERLSMSYLKYPLQLPSLRGLHSLTDLNLKGINLMEVPKDIGSSLPCLVFLNLDHNNFQSLPSLSGLSKLNGLFLNGCRNLVEITYLPQNLNILEMDGCSALERMPDFSGMLTSVTLESPKLIEFPGLVSALNSGLGIYMFAHNNVIDFLLKDGTLQGWTGSGIMNLVGRQIPTWFNHVNEGTQVSFEVPKEIGCNAKALAVCLACCPYGGNLSKFCSCIYVINETKSTSFYVEILDYDFREEYLWLGKLSLSKTEFNLEEGNLVHVIALCQVSVVKKIGVRLVRDKLMTLHDPLVSYHSIPYDRALEIFSKEDDDFDEDDDDEEDQDDDEDDYEDDDDDDDANDEDDDNHGDDDDEPVVHSLESDKPETGSIEGIGGGGGGGEGEEEEPVDKPDDPMEEDVVNPAAVFCIRLKQPRSSLQTSVPELCRNFSAVAWCGKLNAIACASETCASIPSFNANAPFWIPIHIVIPERPTECTVFNVNADSPRDSVQFIEWSPTSCPRALLIANFHGRVTIWTQPSQGPANLVHDANRWQREHEWQQDIAVVTKWLSGESPYKWLSSKSSTSFNGKLTFEEKSLSQQSQNSARWPSFLCVCSVFSSGFIQLHWSQYPANQTGAAPKWFQTSKGLLGALPSGIMAADAVITDSGAMHVAGVPIVNPSTVVVWEVTPGLGNGFHTTPKISTTNRVPPSINPPIWAGFSPLAAYLFSWQDYLLSEPKQRRKQTDQDFSDTVPLHCSLVSNFLACVSSEAASQSATTTTWGSGVTAVAFDPTNGGSVIAVVIVEGQYMSPYDPDEGPSITRWRVQRWESSLQPVVLHQIFGNPTSSLGGQAPMQTVWLSKVDTSIQPTNDFKSHQAAATTATTDARKTSDSGIEKVKRVSFDPFDQPSDVRTLARIVYSAHGGEIAVAFLRGGVHIFSGSNFAPVDNYKINVGAAIAAPAFSSTSCCSASVWYDSVKDRTVLKIIRVLPPAVPSSQVKANSSTWERAIAERFWWSLLVGVDWWDVVGCTRSAAEDGIVSRNSVIAVLDANFHSLPSAQHRQRFGPCLDRLKCRLLEGTKAQEVRAMVLDKQAGLLNPSALVPEPWQASGETLSGIDPEATAVEPALVPHIQNMPRPRGADDAGLLLRELELRPPAEERRRRNMYGEPWSGPDDMGPQDDNTKLCNSSDPPDSGSLESCDVYYGADGLLPRKRGMSERDATFGLNTSVGLGQCFKRQRHRRSGSW